MRKNIATFWYQNLKKVLKNARAIGLSTFKERTQNLKIVTLNSFDGSKKQIKSSIINSDKSKIYNLNENDKLNKKVNS